MQKIKYLCGMFLLMFLLIFQIISCGGGGDNPPGITYTAGTPFVTSDLAGSWYIFATNGASSNGTAAGNVAQGNLRGLLNINSLGQVASGSYTRSNGGSASITGGLFTIDNAGVLSGSFTTNLGVNFYLGSGKMDLSKNIISFVTNTNYGEFDLFTAIRAEGSFASSDLADTWYIFSASGDHANMAMSDAGNGTGLITSPGGGGFINIDGNGVLSGNGFVTTTSGTALYLTPSSSLTPVPNGKMNSAKNLMSFPASTISGEYDLVTAMRAGGTFAPSDLAGTWYIFGSVTSGTNQSTISGTVILDLTGKITGGSYIRSDGGKASFTGGAVTIDGQGILSGNATTDINDNMNLTSGKMHVSKDIMSIVANTALNEQDFLFCIKGS